MERIMTTDRPVRRGIGIPVLNQEYSNMPALAALAD
jgi:hypothetical protein